MSTDSTQQIEEEASVWLARRDSDSWSPDHEAAFQQWIDQSALHRVAFLRLENAWEEALRLQALRAGARSEQVPRPGTWDLSPEFAAEVAAGEIHEPRRWRLAQVACAIVAVAVAGAWWAWWPAGQSYETAIGGIESVPMADGSKVILNTDTEIRIRMTEQERRIDLKRGEAFFEVAKDPSRPFVVRAGHRRVVAVGTKFLVRWDDTNNAGDIRVVVNEGAVRVTSDKDGGVENISASPLTANTVARLTPSGVLMQTTSPAQVAEQLSWMKGVLVFRDITLKEAAAEFNRYNTRKIVIADESVAALRIGGNFRANNIDGFARLIQQGYPVDCQEHRDEIVITAR